MLLLSLCNAFIVFSQASFSKLNLIISIIDKCCDFSSTPKLLFKCIIYSKCIVEFMIVYTRFQNAFDFACNGSYLGLDQYTVALMGVCLYNFGRLIFSCA